MNFRNHERDEPEINLIPFIDILLVVLIFLMLTTTYNKFRELQINLPAANAEAVQSKPQEIVVAVAHDGRYAINGQVLEVASVEALVRLLRETATGNAQPVVVINADAAATHQSVINVMDAARRSGLSHITFATTASTR
ncbi:MAG: ExbD/TolR family protein [Macromonas sp.]